MTMAHIGIVCSIKFSCTLYNRLKSFFNRHELRIFVSGLPDHIRMDVELRGPQDLQTAMYYARAFERRAVAIQQESPSRAAGSLPWPDVPAQGRPAQASAAPLAATAARPFRRLTRVARQGLKAVGVVLHRRGEGKAAQPRQPAPTYR